MTPTVSIREILFPTDFSEVSRGPGEAAAGFARHFGARLHLLHVLAAGANWAAASTALDHLAQALAPDLVVIRHVASGAAAREIVGYAERVAIDLIVIGTHGRSGVSRMLLGSVAEAVVRLAPCRVLVVPVGAAVPTVDEPAPAPPAANCVVCARPSPELICDTCRGLIRRQAFEPPARTGILVVDDEPEVLSLMAGALRREGLVPEATTDSRQAMALLRSRAFDVVITDAVMPHYDGMALLEAAKTKNPDVEVIVVTAYGTPDLVRAALAKGAVAFIDKPLGTDTLVADVREAVWRSRAKKLERLRAGG